MLGRCRHTEMSHFYHNLAPVSTHWQMLVRAKRHSLFLRAPIRATDIRDRERERERGGNCRNLLRFKITLLRPVVVRPEGKFLHEGSSPLLSSLLSPPFITPENNYGQAIFHRVVMRIERCLSFSCSWKENNASLWELMPPSVIGSSLLTCRPTREFCRTACVATGSTTTAAARPRP